MALSGLFSFLCKSLFISQSIVNSRGSVASDLVLAKLLSKDNFFAVNSFPILSLGSFEGEALVSVYRDDPVAGATLISHLDILRASGEATMPVRKSKRTKAQAKALPVIHPRDVDFGHLWRQFVRVGWASKRPTQLSNSLSYSSPNPRKDPHVEGVNMFIGELAVVRCAIADSYDVTLPEEPESVTASQIDKTVALSAKAVEDLFGSESEDDGERTQRIEGPKPENEVRLSQIDTSLALSANTIDDILRGEMSGEEEEVARVLFRSMGRPEHVAAAGDSASPSNSGQSDAAAEPATPLIPDVNDVLLPLHLNTEDVNVMKDGENADDYESFGSEADGSGSSDDERIERRQIGDEVLAGEEEMSLMDAAFIDCLGGSLSIEDMDQNTLHSMVWSPVSSELEPDAHAFPGMSDQVARPSADIRAKKDSPVELLFYFMPTYPWRHITRETNRYKKVHVDEKA
ncbi:hypothetical protein JG688_00015193, partial [Phytophthora aleatoria]